MPPKKRTAAATAVAATPAKKTRGKAAQVVAAEEPPAVKEEPVTKENIAAKLREADKNKVVTHVPDKAIPNSTGYSVYGEYDCTLNQTNIGHNNNKFYIIQVLQSGGAFYCWNRWGRVGETGMNNGMEYCGGAEDAVKSFEKKFKDKTKNDWKDRANFVPHSGKYTLIEMDASEDTSSATTSTATPKATASKDTKPSKLDPETQDLIGLIFNSDMFKDQLKKFDIDVKKMPLGKLSKSQIAKGFEVLEEIEAALKAKKGSTVINELSSKFYTVIPGDFGRQRPPPIADEETLQKKYDMLMVLSDIELAQSMQESKEKETAKDDDKPPHPLDQNYEMLNAELTLLDKKSEEFKVIQTYTQQTQCSYRKVEILDAWRVSRKDEEKRFKAHNSVTNRKLLWHGTNVAVVVAILKTGLRIMPHSGGRVGRGIYFASENGKSAGYVGTTVQNKQNVGIMFLNEVALGKEQHIFQDNSSLVKPPPGFDSIVARGRTEPDPKLDTKLTLEGKQVTVPQGKPISMGLASTSFSQSEYLIYDESQNRIRYLLKMKFSY